MAFPWDQVAEQNHTFVPIQPKPKISEVPTFHDRLPADKGRFTGAIYCTLTCLTPTLAGHFRYRFGDSSRTVRDWAKRCVREILEQYRLNNQNMLPVDGKSVLEPLTLGGTLDNPGPVLIPGDAIKAALFRHPTQALLNAPMERVAERKIAYRVFAPKDYDEMKLFFVKSVNGGDGMTSGVQLMELDAQSVLWPRGNVARNLLEMAEGSTSFPDHPITLPRGTELQNARPDRSLLLDGSGTYRLTREYKLYHYVGNLDGKFELARRFIDVNKPPRIPAHYRCLLVGVQNQGQTVEISPEVLQRFEQTIDFLSDSEEGHLAAHPLLKGPEDVSSIRRSMREEGAPQSRQLRVGELVWAEVRDNQVRSFGRWRSYFWRYRDSVLKREDRPRSETQPLEVERRPVDGTRSEDDKVQEFRLSGGRLLHGFVVTQSARRRSDPHTEGIGPQLRGIAGRVQVNTAMEVFRQQSEPDARFVGSGDSGFCVLGRPVAGAKVSSPEIYLQQKPVAGNDHETRKMKTWGDFYEGDQLSGALAGRKCFPHAKPRFEFDPGEDVESDTNQDVESDTKKVKSDAKKAKSDAKKAEFACGEHVPVLRLISAEGTQFRFRAQFENLRLWELGAMLFSLNCDRRDVKNFLEKLGCTSTEDLQRLSKDYGTQERVVPQLGWIFSEDPDDSDDSDSVPDFAAKIGYQKQRGMGSVAVTVDHMESVSFDGDLPTCCQADAKLAEEAKAAFYERIAELLPGDGARKQYVGGVLAPWLDWRQYRGKHRVRRRYRSLQHSTLEYHKEVREWHKENRLS